MVKGIVSIVIVISISFHGIRCPVDLTNNTFSGTTKVTASLHPTTTWWMWRRTQLLEQRWPAASQANRTVTFGTQHALDPSTTVKARYNSNGMASALIQHEWRPKSFFTLTTEVDTKALEKSSKVGLSVVLKPWWWCRSLFGPRMVRLPYHHLWLTVIILNSEHLPGSTLVSCGIFDSASLPFCKCHSSLFGVDVVELNRWNYQWSRLLAYGYFCSDHSLASCAYFCVLLFSSLASIL